MNKTVDYVVVGAGSAGCVLANKLSESGKYSVLVIESGGPDTSWLIDMPRGVGKLLAGGPNLWEYDAKVAANSDRREPWLTGKTLGGSSSVNGMIYTRGHPEDYNSWERAGCGGWGWDEIGRCFVALENHELGAGTWRGDKGPLKITMQAKGYELCEAMLDAAEQAGVPRVDDTNMAWDGGFGYQPGNIHGGRRQSAAKAFLRDAEKRSNVQVLTSTDVRRVVFEGRCASGVELRDKSGTRSVNVRREIILSAGGLHTPQLLQLSGIGPGALLKQLGIPVVVDAPNVGGNLHDHRYLPVTYEVTGGSLNPEFSGLGLLRSLARYFFKGKGPMTHAAHEIAGFAKTRPHLTRPDCQIGGCLYSVERTAKGPVIGKGHGMTIGGYFTRPESQGSVKITANDLDAPLDIDANYMSAQEDRDAAVALLRFIRRYVAQPALARYVVKETLPGPGVQTDDEIVNAFLELGSTSFHYSGTCRMGSDAESVVDPSLRVRGVQGLRVADASIMPTLMSGNTNSTCMVIGMRAAEIILTTQA